MNVRLDLLSIDLPSVHVFARVLRVLLLLVLDMSESSAKYRMQRVVEHLYVFDYAVRAKNLNNMLLGYVSAQLANVNASGSRWLWFFLFELWTR